jgi:hypothetical protein
MAKVVYFDSETIALMKKVLDDESEQRSALRRSRSISQSLVAWRYTKALSPVIALPTINVFISRVPS